MNRATRERAMRILMIGPLPPPVGGSTVLFKSLVDGLRKRTDVTVKVVNTVGVRGSGTAAPFKLLGLFWRVLCGMRTAHVAAVHVVTTGMHVLLPMVVCAARIWGKPLVVRKFGGRGLEAYSPVRRSCILWALRRADLYLVEIRQLVGLATEQGLVNVAWYANSRPMPAQQGDSEEGTRECRRFVFIGQLHRGKGLEDLMDAAERLPEGASVDVYGIPGFDFPAWSLEGRRNVTYHGPVDPADVVDILSWHDALVLPTYLAREGHPGVILEAYAAGRPVISTRVGGIPELVDESTGILVEPRDVDALSAAMLSLVHDPELWRRLRDGVLRRRGEFSDEIWQERFVEYCRGIAKSGGRRHRTSARD